MDDPRRSEILRVSSRVRDIILVREEQVFHATFLVEGVHQASLIARGIHQPVPLRVANEIAIGPEGLPRVEAVVKDLCLQLNRKARRSSLPLGLVWYNRPDRSHWASQQGLIGLVEFPRAPGLMVDRREFSVLHERGGRQLPTGIAINAGRIHKEIPARVGAEPFGQRSHEHVLLVLGYDRVFIIRRLTSRGPPLTVQVC